MERSWLWHVVRSTLPEPCSTTPQSIRGFYVLWPRYYILIDSKQGGGCARPIHREEETRVGHMKDRHDRMSKAKRMRRYGYFVMWYMYDIATVYDNSKNLIQNFIRLKKYTDIEITKVVDALGQYLLRQL